MKKRAKNKKKVVGSIGLLTAAVCCFGVAPAANAISGDLYSARTIKVFADSTDEQAAEYLSIWQESIATLKNLDGDISTKENYVDYFSAYLNANEVYPHVLAGITPEDQIVYDTAAALVGADVNCYKYFSITLYNLVATENIHWSDKAAYDNNCNYINYIDGMKAEVIVEMVGKTSLLENVEYANVEFERIKNAMDAVITAIDGIYYGGQNSDEIVVDSKDTLDTVTNAIKEVYGVERDEISEKEINAMVEYGVEIQKYDDAIKYYNDNIVTVSENFDARIIEVYNSFTKEDGENFDKYYTQREIIETLKANYDALKKGDDNDITSLIEESEKLEKLVKSLEDVDQAKANVESLIALIDAEFDYKNDYIKTVTDARAAFDDTLPADLKAIADTEIEGYADLLVSAEGKIEECALAVNNLKERAGKLQALYDAGDVSFSKEVTAIKNAYIKFTYQKQKDDFDKDCGALLAEMQAKSANLSITVQPVIDAINAIGEVKLSNTAIGTQLKTAWDLYNALETAIEKNSVSNYNVLSSKQLAFEELTKDAADWKAAVEAIELAEKITVQNIADINEVERIFTEEFDDDMRAVISSDNSGFSYDIYEDLIEARNALLQGIETLASAMTNLSTDLDIISADPTAFTSSVEGAKEAYSALDATVQAEYFVNDEATNNAAYGNYLNALNLYNEVYELVGKIIALGDGTTVNMSDYENIYSYIDEYETLTDENKQIVIDGGYKEILDTAKSTVDALKSARDAWIEKVNALAGEVEKEVWESDLYSVDLKAVAELKAERQALDNSDGGLDETDLDLAAIETIGNKRVTDLNGLINELNDKSALEKTDIEVLKSIYDIYNNKLHEEQKAQVEYDKFEVLYNKYVFAQNFDEAVAALYEDVVTNGNYTTDVPATIGILRSIYVNFGSEMKELIEKYELIDEIEEEYNAHVESEGGVLNLTQVYNELAEMIENNSGTGENLGAQINELAEKVTAIETAYIEADNALKGLLEQAYLAGDEKLASDIEGLQATLTALQGKLEKADEDIVADIAKVREELADAQEALNGIIDGVKKELQGKIDELTANLGTAKDELGKVDKELASDIEGLQATLTALQGKLEKADEDIIADIAKVREELADAQEALNGIIDGVKKELQGKIDALESELAKAKVDLAKVDADNKKELNDLINGLTAQLNQAKESLEKADTDNLAAINSEVAQIKAELEQRIEDLETAFKAADEVLKTELKKEIDSLRKSLSTVIIIFSTLLGLTVAGVVVVGVVKKKQ